MGNVSEGVVSLSHDPDDIDIGSAGKSNVTSHIIGGFLRDSLVIDHDDAEVGSDFSMGQATVII